MVIDTLASMPAIQETDIKIKKRNEAEDLNSIEESGESNSPELDFNKEEIANRRAEDSVRDAGKTYGAKGHLARENTVEKGNNNDNGNIDIMV
ncbi:hypothetical protein ACFL0H_01095 [Thermodesulfobacteriota bacterium]